MSENKTQQTAKAVKSDLLELLLKESKVIIELQKLLKESQAAGHDTAIVHIGGVSYEVDLTGLTN